MQRSSSSHKGENGKVAVIGGSRTVHGAPIFCALAAEASGADLVYISLPACHADIARMHSLNVQVNPFAGDDLTAKDVRHILELLATMDSAVMGPGIARDNTTLSVLKEIIAEASCALVLDATALQPWTLEAVSGKTAVLTPHLGELERMEISPIVIGEKAKVHGVTIHLKGTVDRVATPTGAVREIAGGNAGLTVGGTGDALAGLIAGLIAQGMEPPEACAQASTIVKRAGTVLAQDFGYAYGTRRVIEQIPRQLRNAGEHP
jgi:ADP-dependent NAD(P)H-hydrate dehydratase / NAD(P)H-hydrate epimerase